MKTNISTPAHNIDVKQVYEWVKTGHWSLKDFREWLDELKSNIRQDGYNDGYDAGQEASKDWP